MDSTKLEGLFDLVCDDFKKKLDKEGGMSTGDMKLLLEFLEQNQVNCVGMNNKKITSIVDKLPFSEESEDGLAINQ